MTGAGRFAAGLLVGVVIAVSLAVLLRDGEETVTTTTTTSLTASEPQIEPWFEAGEVLIGATAILPRELDIDDGTAYFDYDLAGLGPTIRDDGEERLDLATPHGDHMAMPEHWVLMTTSGQTIPGTSGPFDTSVSFDLPDENDTVTSITLVGWRIAAPLAEQIELTIVAGESATMQRGSVTIETVLEQSISTIVQVDVDHVGDSWESNISLRPLDRHWRTTGRQGGGLQLIWEGTDPPETVVLEDAGFTMRPVTGEILVFEDEDA
jgi:hypothetical protein